MTEFTKLGLSATTLQAVADTGYTEATPIQASAIPVALAGRDVLGIAQTGTGKTAAFTLPMIDRLGSGRARARMPRALVLAPTRELADQVAENFAKYAKGTKLSWALLIGGVSMGDQVALLNKGVDVLIATPGRLLDLFERGKILLTGVEMMVIDEADRMLDMGFIHDVKKVLARLPAKRQNLLFSATFSKDITDLADKLLHNPERIEVTPPNTTVERIEQRVYRLPASHKRALLAHLITTGAWEQVLVFTRTKHGANRLAEYLEKHGLTAAAIHGNKSQNARTKALADFKAGTVRIMVATDIAARGLDIDQLPHVVNFELPNVEEDYVHRIGRTGRAGRSGEAISLVAPDEEKLLKSIERVTRQKIPDGDLMGFDASKVEAEKPEVRERPQNNPRGGRGQRADGTNTGNGGRKDKGKDQGKEKGRDKDKEKTAEKSAGGRQERKPRDNKKPRPQQSAQAGVPSVPANRDPEEFLDDEVDNFGNRADYVSPYQNKGNQGRNRRPGAPAQAGAGASGQPRSGGGQGRNNNGPRTGTGGSASGEKRGGSRNGGGGQPRRDGGGARNRRPNSDNQSGEPAVRNPREGQPQPKIMHKESKIDRFPTAEQLEQLPSRPRGEKPALLTRNR